LLDLGGRSPRQDRFGIFLLRFLLDAAERHPLRELAAGQRSQQMVRMREAQLTRESEIKPTRGPGS